MIEYFAMSVAYSPIPEWAGQTHAPRVAVSVPFSVEVVSTGIANGYSIEFMPDGRLLLAVLSGENPYTADGKCDAGKELRLGLYLVKGKTAQRVLEWPAATCALGRATSVVLDEEGALSIGYSNGPTINFAWSGDHFERTELGER